jgi:FtsP/CotA-like multicopper oxidase with cupredoxin domain
MSEHYDDAPAAAMLGTAEGGTLVHKTWSDPVSENPNVGDTEVWEFYNATADAHPIHIHETVFQVLNRQSLATNEEEEVIQPIQVVGDPRPPEPWESGFKDTVTAYPAEVTRVRGQFNTPGQFVWHCHIVEHEDNEMMRPYRIGPPQQGQPE